VSKTNHERKTNVPLWITTASSTSTLLYYLPVFNGATVPCWCFHAISQRCKTNN